MKRGRRRRWTPEAGIEALRSLAAELGRAPTSRETGTPRCPSSRWFADNFGRPYSEVLLSQGLLPAPVARKMSPIDPVKAAKITHQKRAWWENGGDSWIHPYRVRRSA